MYKGIDVSDNQGIIDWEKVKEAGCQFAILRSVRRSGKTDYQFEANLNGCQNIGIPVSVYKYTYAITETESVTEANQVVALLQKHNLNCIVWWDVEDRDTLYSLGKEKLTACIKAAQKVIEAAGFKFGIYTGLYVYKEKWFDFSQFTCPLWTARYPSTAQKTLESMPNEKYLPDVGRDIWGWQFSNNGKISGISTRVDLDICYEEIYKFEESETDKGYMLITYGLTLQQADGVRKQLNNCGIDNILCKAMKNEA